MWNNPILSLVVLAPLARIGRGALVGITYLGALGTLVGSATRSVFRPSGQCPAFVPATTRQAATLLAMGLPLVGLVHVGLGSFLSMQAYFGGTFVDGTGAVVGVGLIRNAAPLMAGMTLAVLIAARTVWELRGRPRSGLDAEPGWAVDRDPAPGRPAGADPAPEPARLAAVRIAAALVVGPVLALWGILVGTVVGWQVGKMMLGVSTHAFFFMLTEMIWLRDVVGLVIKGLAFALFAALFACHEGLRGSAHTDPDSVPSAACRAASLASVAILVFNSGWFLLVYHAGPAFGPTLLAPPAP